MILFCVSMDLLLYVIPVCHFYLIRIKLTLVFRYCKEEPFSVVSLDIRNLSRLQESLEAYVRGELLEGPDAYHCDKCNKKVSTFY